MSAKVDNTNNKIGIEILYRVIFPKKSFVPTNCVIRINVVNIPPRYNKATLVCLCCVMTKAIPNTLKIWQVYQESIYCFYKMIICRNFDVERK